MANGKEDEKMIDLKLLRDKEMKTRSNTGSSKSFSQGEASIH